MGTDIHGHWQVKIKRDYEDKPYWEDKLYTDYSRAYPLFATLANVRNYNDIPFISEPRGLPEEFTKFGFSDNYDLGDHSYSWLLGSEIKSHIEKHPPECDYDLIEDMHWLAARYGYDNIRFVFGFDS